MPRTSWKQVYTLQIRIRKVGIKYASYPLPKALLERRKRGVSRGYPPTAFTWQCTNGITRVDGVVDGDEQCQEYADISMARSVVRRLSDQFSPAQEW